MTALYRPKGTKIWTMDFVFKGQRIRESTGMTSKTRAREVQDRRKQGLREGVAGIRPHIKPLLFSTAARELLETSRLAKYAPQFDADDQEAYEESGRRSSESVQQCLAHLLPSFGNKLLLDIQAGDIEKYQTLRLNQHAANATVNREVGLLRKLMRKHGVWASISDGVKMLPEPRNAGKSLTAAQERVLLIESQKSKSRFLFPLVVIAIDTGARLGTIRRIRWKHIDFARHCLRFGKDKTRAGTGRIVPLSSRASSVLEQLANQFPDRKPDHYVFPCERTRKAN